MYHTSAIDIQYTCSVRGVFIACVLTRGRKMRSICHVINTFMINSYICQTLIRELKQRRRRRQRKRHKNWQNGKTTTLRVRHSFFVHFFHDVTMPNFSFCEGREHEAMAFFFFFWTLIQSQNSTPEKIAKIWRTEWDRISAIKFETARPHFLNDVFVAVAIVVV